MRNCEEKDKSLYFNTFNFFPLLFEREASHFNFSLGSENYLANPAYTLDITWTPQIFFAQILNSSLIISKSQIHSNSRTFSKYLNSVLQMCSDHKREEKARTLSQNGGDSEDMVTYFIQHGTRGQIWNRRRSIAENLLKSK